MAREIKFKAWDKRTNQMFENSKFLELGRGLITMVQTLYPDLPDMKNSKGGLMLPTDDENIVFLQYTGLKDKNGKEIYEGDVIEYGILGTNSTQKRAVIFNPKYGFIVTNTNYMPRPSDNPVVIGNIYENPDLLSE